MYRLMSRWPSSAASRISSAQTRLARSSSTCWPRTTIRCRSRRWNTCSAMMGAGGASVRARMLAGTPARGGVLKGCLLVGCSRAAAGAGCSCCPWTLTRPWRPLVRSWRLFADGAGAAARGLLAGAVRLVRVRVRALLDGGLAERGQVDGAPGLVLDGGPVGEQRQGLGPEDVVHH